MHSVVLPSTSSLPDALPIVDVAASVVTVDIGVGVVVGVGAPVVVFVARSPSELDEAGDASLVPSTPASTAGPQPASAAKNQNRLTLL